MWLAKVLSVDAHVQSARVEFFTPAQSLGLCKSEQVTGMRTRTENIRWELMLSLASGSWIENMFQPTVNVGRY